MAILFFSNTANSKLKYLQKLQTVEEIEINVNNSCLEKKAVKKLANDNLSGIGFF